MDAVLGISASGFPLFHCGTPVESYFCVYNCLLLVTQLVPVQRTKSTMKLPLSPGSTSHACSGRCGAIVSFWRIGAPTSAPAGLTFCIIVPTGELILFQM